MGKNIGLKESVDAFAERLKKMKIRVKLISALFTSIAAVTMSVAVSASDITASSDAANDNEEYNIRIEGSDHIIQTAAISITKDEMTESTGYRTIEPGMFDEGLKNIEDAYIIDLKWNELKIENNSAPEPDIKCSFTVDVETVAINAFINNTYEADKDVVIVIAQYNDMGRSVNVTYKRITVPGNTITPKQYTVRADEVSEDKDSVCGFVWEDFESIKPLSKLTE